MPGSTIVITYDGTDISGSCIFAECSFEAQMAAVPGTFTVTVRDMDRTLNFVTGKELTLDVDGKRLYGGYVTQVTQRYAFPADNTADLSRVHSREWVLSGVDYNVLFDKLILHNSADYTHDIPVVSGDPYDGTIIRTWFDNYFDLPAGFTFNNATYVLNNHQWGASQNHHYIWPTQGATMRQVLEDLAIYGSVFWMAADKTLRFIPVQDTAASWGFSDQPNNDPIGVGTPTRGFREGEYSIANDALVWGGSEWAAGGAVVFDRRTNSTSITNHGRWQIAENRVGDAKFKILAQVTARAKVIVDGNESGTTIQGSQGLVNPEDQFRCTWFNTGVPVSGGSPVHLVPGLVVPIELWVFSQDAGVHPFLVNLPLRQVRITFPTLENETGKAYAQFEGFFGVQMADPFWLWSYLRSSKSRLPRGQLISSANNSTVNPPYAAQYQDVPSPAADGSTTVFTIPFGYIAGTSQVFVAGLLLMPGDYTESNPAAGQYTLAVAPTTGQTIWVKTTLTGG